MKIGNFYFHGLGSKIGATRPEIEQMERAVEEWWTWGLGRSASRTPHLLGSGSEQDPDELTWSMQRVESALTKMEVRHMPKRQFSLSMKGLMEFREAPPVFGLQVEFFAIALVAELKEHPRPKYFEEV